MSTTQPILTPEQTAELRSELQRILARLERGMKSNGNGRPTEIDQGAVGRLSRIEAIQNQGLTQNLHERERVQLAEVMAALLRLDEGSYGVCTSCRGAIRYERLLVFPEARTCAQCGVGG